MINSENFIKRLEVVFEYYSISASAFADKIGVQRSALSHLLSGRNKPSLDFVLRIIDSFPEVDLYWLLNGIGTFPKNETVQNEALPSPITNSESFDLFSAQESQAQGKERMISNKEKEFQIEQTLRETRLIDRIVIFYKDGTFKNYTEL